MLKIVVLAAVGYLIWTNPGARQITGDLFRSTGDAIAPEKDGKTFEDRVKDVVVEKVLEDQ
jgi:hypothetical protein